MVRAVNDGNDMCQLILPLCQCSGDPYVIQAGSAGAYCKCVLASAADLIACFC